jgi:hypothetical protein
MPVLEKTRFYSERRLELDIEGPQSPIHSIRDFGIHIATVTIGILIALSLEALIEAHHDHMLVEHARDDFRSEFQGNRTALMKDLKAGAATKTELEALIAYGQNRLAGKKAALPQLASTRSFTQIHSTAWDTATATQAVIHLPFKEARLISTAQSKQVAFNLLENRAEDEWFELAAFGDPQQLPKEQIAPALQKVMIAYAYLVSTQDAERQLISAYSAALNQLAAS